MSLHGSPSLEIEPSRGLQRVIVAVVWGVFLIVPFFVSSLSPRTSLLVALIGIAATAFSFWREGWLGGRRRIALIYWQADGEWRLKDFEGRQSVATLTSGTRVLGPITWLRFASECGRRQVLQWRGGLGADRYRRLVVRLRLEAGKPSKSDPDLPIPE